MGCCDDSSGVYDGTSTNEPTISSKRDLVRISPSVGLNTPHNSGLWLIDYILYEKPPSACLISIFIRVVTTVILPITLPAQRDASSSLTLELIAGASLVFCDLISTVGFIQTRLTVIFLITDPR